MSEVKLGYKQTEVGVIPEDWDLKPIAQIGDVIRGASPRPKGDKRYYGGDIPRLMVQDVTRDGKFVTPAIDFLTEEGAKRSRPCKKGTLTIVCSGTVGVVSFLNVDACIHDGFLALIGIKSTVSDDYLYHQLSNLQESFDSSATHGGVFTNLTTTGVKEFKVLLPPTKAEQTAIAEALSDADALIASLEQLIAKKRRLKQGAMQTLLTGQQRLPGFEVKPGTKQTDVGVTPEDWEVKTLGSVATYKNGKAHEGSISAFGKYIVVNSKFISTNGEVKNFSDERFSPASEGEILMVMSDVPNGRAIARCFFVECNDLYTVNQRICALSPIHINGKLLFYKLNRNPYYLAFDDGAKQTNLRKNDVLSCFLTLPPTKAEQSAIATILSDMDTEISTLEAKLAKARQLKQGMMQELLTGRIRLTSKNLEKNSKKSNRWTEVQNVEHE